MNNTDLTDTTLQIYDVQIEIIQEDAETREQCDPHRPDPIAVLADSAEEAVSAAIRSAIGSEDEWVDPVANESYHVVVTDAKLVAVNPRAPLHVDIDCRDS